MEGPWRAARVVSSTRGSSLEGRVPSREDFPWCVSLGSPGAVVRGGRGSAGEGGGSVRYGVCDGKDEGKEWGGCIPPPSLSLCAREGGGGSRGGGEGRG